MTLPAVVRSGGMALLLALLPGCTTPSDGAADAAPAAATPGSPEQLQELLLPTVPSGLPRVPDDSLTPPAGEKTIEDVAGYAEDPVREREVLDDYGYRFGWERYWGSGSGPLTTVFASQFHTVGGAGQFTADLAEHDASVYGGVLSEDPSGLPSGCRLLVLTEGAPHEGVAAPTAFAWCAHGAFSVVVTAVAGSGAAAEEEVRAVATAQLERLPAS